MITKSNAWANSHKGSGRYKRTNLPISHQPSTLDNEIAALICSLPSNVQIEPLDICKVFDAAKQAKSEGRPMMAAILASVEALKLHYYEGKVVDPTKCPDCNPIST